MNDNTNYTFILNIFDTFNNYQKKYLDYYNLYTDYIEKNSQFFSNKDKQVGLENLLLMESDLYLIKESINFLNSALNDENLINEDFLKSLEVVNNLISSSLFDLSKSLCKII